MNGVMFERPLRWLREQRPEWNLAMTGRGRGHGGATQIMEQLGHSGLRQAWQFEVRWRGWDAYLSPDINQPTRRARRAIQLFHGVSFKGKMYRPPIRRFTDLFLIGEDMRRRFIEKGLYEEGDPALHRVGMPKLDAFIDGSLDREAILREIGLDGEALARPVVLYAPTWRPESSLYSYGIELMKRTAEREGWTLLVKLHDWVWDPATNPIDWAKTIPMLEGPCVRFVRGFNIVPYMFVADLLISDASSVANEYLLLDRPILWIDVPQLIAKYEKTIDLEGWGRRTGRIVASNEELCEAIEDGLARPGEFGEVRREAAADIFYHPGEATRVFCEKLLELIEPC